MRILSRITLACGLLCGLPSAMAQGPPDIPQAPPESADTFADRMLSFDKDKDGKLTKAEVTDERLHRLFARADADKDGTVTRRELLDLAAKEAEDDRKNAPDFGPGPGPGGDGFPGGGPPGGPGGPGGPGRGGPGGPMMMPRPGEVLPAMLRQRLKLTTEQAKQLDELQKDVDSRLAKILTEEQSKTLRQMRMGPGGPGGRRGPGGFGPGGPAPRGPGGPPPGGPPPD